MGESCIRYISEFDVYQGRNTMPKDYNFHACLGLGESVVAPASKKLSCLFDNYFSIVPLMEYLKNENVFAIRSNRKYLTNNLTTDKVMNESRWF